MQNSRNKIEVGIEKGEGTREIGLWKPDEHTGCISDFLVDSAFLLAFIFLA